MLADSFEAAWQRVREGKTTVVLGSVGPGRPHPPDLGVVRADCDVTGLPFSAIHEALQEAAALGGPQRTRLDEHAERVWSGLRRRFLGETAEPSQASDLVMAMNHLRGDRLKPVLVLTAVDRADEASLRTLRAVLRRRDWLRVPALLVYRTSEPAGMSGELLRPVRQLHGDDAVLLLGKGGTPSRELDLRALPAPVLRVLRAAAVLGPTFEVADLAALLAVERLDVLETLQQASDAGVPLEDRGEGRLHVPEPLVASLKEGLLPSLASAWHGQLAHLFSRQVEALSDPAAQPGPAPSVPPPTAAEAVTLYGSELEPASMRPTALRAGAAGATGAQTRNSPPGAEQSGEVGPGEAGEPASPQSLEESNSPTQVAHEARAARHAEAAGDYDAAARHFLAAAEGALLMHAHEESHLFVHRALSLLEARPMTDDRRRLLFELRLTHARLQWQAALPGSDFTLGGALGSLETAQKLLVNSDPPDMHAGVAQLVAGVCYDIGEGEALQRALRELNGASELLLARDRTLDAARLLNDQAAVWVRIGEPDRARDLLSQSKSIFSELAGSDGNAMHELAETEHMLARLALDDASSDGPALAEALEHAQRAAGAHRASGDRRGLARVLDTLGRLERVAERHDQASQHLLDAVHAQQELGDVIGLASSTEALAELLADMGDAERALELLGESVALNFDKGSPRGLALNRQALAKLEARLDAPRDRLAFAFRKLDEQLRAAEAAVGTRDGS